MESTSSMAAFLFRGTEFKQSCASDAATVGVANLVSFDSKYLMDWTYQTEKLLSGPQLDCSQLRMVLSCGAGDAGY